MDEINARNVELARIARDLDEENKKLKKVLSEVADRAFYCPVDSERIGLNKIKELVREYQSQN